MTTRYQQGQKAEKRVAKVTGGRVQPGSGSKWFAKGDVLVGDQFLIQVKNTTRKSYTLTLADLRELEGQALAIDRQPVFVVEFDTPKGRYLYKVQRYWKD